MSNVSPKPSRFTRRVTVSTGARLHFGPLSYSPGQSQHFGGVGLMVDSPGVCITLGITVDDSKVPAPAQIATHVTEKTTPKQAQEIRRCVEQAVSAFQENVPAATHKTGIRVDVLSSISRHVGLGSGTQLAMAITKAMSVLIGDDTRSAIELANSIRRGARSAIGVHGFEHGGFLVDGGKQGRGAIGVLAAREAIPEEWRFVLITPSSVQGLSGLAEQEAFARLSTMSAPTADRLRRIAYEELRPAITGGQFDRFADGLFEFGRTVGDYFSPVQGGTYAAPRTAELVELLRSRGVRGVAQTSWGPTVCAVCRNELEANGITADLRQDSRFAEDKLQTAAPLNRGASVDVISS